MSSKALEIKYIGVVSLLGRLSSQYRMADDEETICLIKRVTTDLTEEMPGRFEIWKVSGGYSLEPLREETKDVLKSA